MNDIQKSILIHLAAEMVRGVNMPSDHTEGWPLPKSASRKLKMKIKTSSDEAKRQCCEWSRQIMAVVREKENT